MAKHIDLGDGYIGRVTGDNWALVTTGGAIIHTGYASDAEQAEVKMRSLLAGGDAVAPAAAEAGESAKESAATSDEATDEAADEDGGKKLKGKLPEGFPGKAALDEAGYGTYAKVRRLHERGELTDVPGIGEVTAGYIGEALAEG